MSKETELNDVLHSSNFERERKIVEASIQGVSKIDTQTSRDLNAEISAKEEFLKRKRSGLEANSNRVSDIEAIKSELNAYSKNTNEYLSKKRALDQEITGMRESKMPESEIQSAISQQSEELKGLEDQFDKDTEGFVTFCNDLLGKFVTTLGGLLEQVKGELEKLQSEFEKEDANSDKGALAKDYKTKVDGVLGRVQNIEEPPKKTANQKGQEQEKAKRDPQDVKKRWMNAATVMKDVKKITTDIVGNFAGMSEGSKEIVNATMDIASSTFEMIGTIQDLAISSSQATTSVGDSAAGSMKKVEKASAILAIISAAMKIVMAIANFFINIFSKDKQLEREIQVLQKEIEVLSEKYRGLKRATDKAYSTEKMKLLQDGNDILIDQRGKMIEQMEKENEKKKTKEEKIKEYKKQIEDVTNKILDNQEAMETAFFGTDLKSSIESLASAMSDAWSGTTNSIMATKDVVKEMIKGVVLEMLKSDLTPSIELFRQKIKAALLDGFIDDGEQSELDFLAEQIAKENDAKYKKFDKYFKGGEVEDESSLTGEIRGTVATEQSVSELGGIFRGQWDSLKAIEFSNQSICENLILSVKVQKEISENTLRSADNSDILVKEISKLKKTFSESNQNKKTDIYGTRS